MHDMDTFMKIMHFANQVERGYDPFHMEGLVIAGCSSDMQKEQGSNLPGKTWIQL